MVVRRRLQGDERFPWLGHDIHPWYQRLTLEAWQMTPLLLALEGCPYNTLHDSSGPIVFAIISTWLLPNCFAI